MRQVKKLSNQGFLFSFLLSFLFFFPFLGDALEKEGQRICLNMIVKNESKVIQKCLNSVKPLIDYWVIVDTGSTDGTQEIIKEEMQGIPGELYERPWVNFEHNRNEALELAKNKADYLFFIDADEYLSYDEGFSLSPLEADCYDMVVRQIEAVDFLRCALVRSSLPWRWEGVLHESLICPLAKCGKVLKGVINLCNTSAPSGRSLDPNKYLKDAAILEEALKKDPNNSRYVFYLAQSYFAGKNKDLALKNYERRASMASADMQETFFAIYNVGKIKEDLGDYQGALKSYFDAYAFRQSRAEPLFRAAVVFRKMGFPFVGYLLSKQALMIPSPPDSCVEYMTYDYALLIEFANCALLCGKWEEGLEASVKLLTHPRIPAEIRPQLMSNYELAKAKLGK